MARYILKMSVEELLTVIADNNISAQSVALAERCLMSLIHADFRNGGN